MVWNTVFGLLAILFLLVLFNSYYIVPLGVFFLSRLLVYGSAKAFDDYEKLVKISSGCITLFCFFPANAPTFHLIQYSMLSPNLKRNHKNKFSLALLDCL